MGNYTFVQARILTRTHTCTCTRIFMFMPKPHCVVVHVCFKIKSYTLYSNIHPPVYKTSVLGLLHCGSGVFAIYDNCRGAYNAIVQGLGLWLCMATVVAPTRS